MALGSLRTRILAASLTIYLVWGSANLAMKFAMATIPPLLVAGSRLLMAGGLLTGFALLRGHRPRRRDWKIVAGAGVLLFWGGHGGIYWGQQRLASSVGALLLATMPLWVVVIEGASPHGIRLGRRAAIGLTLGTLGVLLLVGPTRLLGAGRVNLAGAGALLLGALSWALGSIYSARVQMPAAATLAAGLPMLVGGALLTATAAATGETRGFHLAQVSVASTLAMAFLVVFAGLIGFSCFLYLLRVASPARVSTYAYVNPLVALALGWGLAGDTVNARILAAVAALLAAVALIVTTPNKPPQPPLTSELESTVAP